MDASVVIKWLIPEDDQPKALKIRDLYQEARMNVIAPGLLTAEIGNVLWKRVRSGLLGSAHADKALFRFQQDTPVLPDAIQLACAAAAAIDLFITNDDRLSRKHVPEVKFVTSLERAYL